MKYEGPGISGWMSEKELQWLYETAASMESVVEVGSWCGRSTHAILSSCRGMVTAVDKWDPNDMLEFGDSEEAYKTFCKTAAGFTNLTVLKMDSIQAAQIFEDKSVEMVFIDGTHTYEPFKRDVLAWLPKTKKILCGHDCTPPHHGVWKAVHEMFGSKFKLCDSIWIVKV